MKQKDQTTTRKFKLLSHLTNIPRRNKSNHLPIFKLLFRITKALEGRVRDVISGELPRWLLNSPGWVVPSPAPSAAHLLAFERRERIGLHPSAHSYQEVIQEDNHRYHQQEMNKGADITDEPPQEPENDENDDNGPENID